MTGGRAWRYFLNSGTIKIAAILATARSPDTRPRLPQVWSDGSPSRCRYKTHQPPRPYEGCRMKSLRKKAAEPRGTRRLQILSKMEPARGHLQTGRVPSRSAPRWGTCKRRSDHTTTAV